MLIRRARIRNRGLCDVRLEGQTIAAIGSFEPRSGEAVIDAAGGALLPGLHDHHIHLAGLAARRASVWCGPPEVTDADAFVERLSRTDGTGWIRAIGYHESVLGCLPDAAMLDQIVADRPLRMQHRSGRMWLLNARAIEVLLENAAPPPGLETIEGRYTGRLFDEDTWLRKALASSPPDFGAVSLELARYGLTGITDMTPGNDPAMAKHFASEIRRGALLQHCTVAGTHALSDAAQGPWRLGPVKLHLHENALPEFETATDFIARAHAQDRPTAIHCVSEVELVFALAALEAAGCIAGDRIEHASVTSPELAERMADMGLGVCAQPHFVSERGDQYLADVEARHHPDLYRLRTLSEQGIALAGGSDAPFGSADPWAAMRAAVHRTTASGETIGAGESLSPDDALALYLADPQDLSRTRHIAVGESADLYLLDCGWETAATDLDSNHVTATIASGRLIYNRVDKPEIEGSARA